jgi:iron complex transport system substrate-binding protein
MMPLHTHPARTRSSRDARRALPAVLAVSALALTACGGDTEQQAGGETADDPVTVENCGAEVTFDQEPQRLVLLKSAPVSALHELGVLDRAVARAGAFPEAYYDEETNAQIAQIPELAGDTDASGHLQISKDVVIAQDPDVVFGEVENLPRQGLADLGIPLLEEPLLCSTNPDTEPDFDSVYEQVELYGQVFHREERAAEVVAELKERVETATADVDEDAADQRTAAVLYPTVGGGTTYAYGGPSMPQAQLTAAGYTNVFGDQPDRVFEVTAEQLLGTDPDVIVLLHAEGDPQAVEDSLRALPGAEDLTAVQEDQVMTQLFNFAEPATPLSVDGLEQFMERFGS